MVKPFYAVILQDNVHDVDWDVRLGVDADNINRKVDDGYRVLEFDQFRHHYNDDPSFSYDIFVVILVENTADNTLDAVWKTSIVF